MRCGLLSARDVQGVGYRHEEVFGWWKIVREVLSGFIKSSRVHEKMMDMRPIG